MTDREQQLIDALRRIESEAAWWRGHETRNAMQLRMMDVRAIARDAIIEATQT